MIPELSLVTLLNPIALKGPKLHRVLALLSAIGLVSRAVMSQQMISQ